MPKSALGGSIRQIETSNLFHTCNFYFEDDYKTGKILTRTFWNGVGFAISVSTEQLVLHYILNAKLRLYVEIN